MSKQTQRLEALYAELPAIECQKKCAEACGVILMTRIEWRRIKRVTDRTEIDPARPTTCPMLVNDLCSVYKLRPMICRLWGLVDNEYMRCIFGCKPDRYLTTEEGYSFLQRAREISG